MSQLTENEVEVIVEKTVNATLTKLGFDVTDPIEVQKDQAWVRGTRQTVARGAWTMLVAFIGVIVPGSAVALWHIVNGK